MELLYWVVSTLNNFKWYWECAIPLPLFPGPLMFLLSPITDNILSNHFMHDRGSILSGTFIFYWIFIAKLFLHENSMWKTLTIFLCVGLTHTAGDQEWKLTPAFLGVHRGLLMKMSNFSVSCLQLMFIICLK